jgi:hypothetical protein
MFHGTDNYDFVEADFVELYNAANILANIIKQTDKKHLFIFPGQSPAYLFTALKEMHPTLKNKICAIPISSRIIPTLEQSHKWFNNDFLPVTPITDPTKITIVDQVQSGDSFKNTISPSLTFSMSVKVDLIGLRHWGLEKTSVPYDCKQIIYFNSVPRWSDNSPRVFVHYPPSEFGSGELFKSNELSDLVTKLSKKKFTHISSNTSCRHPTIFRSNFEEWSFDGHKKLIYE